MKILDGKAFKVDADEQETTASLKEKIGEIVQHEPSNLRLIANQKIMQDESTIADYNIHEDDMLQFICFSVINIQ